MPSLSQAGQYIAGKVPEMSDEEIRQGHKIERMRRNQEERLERFIKNPHARSIGIDVGALKKQEEEKQVRVHKERVREQQYAHEQKMIHNYLETFELEQSHARRENQKQLQESWRHQQRAKQAKEAQLQQREDSLSILSKVTWNGEDRFAGDRAALQKQQMKKWLDQQVTEKRNRAEKLCAEDAKYATNNVVLNAYRGDLEKQMQQQRAARNRRMMEENKQLAALARERKASQKSRDNRLSTKVVEVQTALADVARSRGPLTKEQISEILAEQGRQRDEQRQRKQAKSAATVAEFKMSQQMYRHAASLDYEQEERKLRKDKEHQAQLLQAMRAKPSGVRDKKKDVAFSEDFFSKFGRSVR